ncbi:MAG: alpha/beta fold hydrolase [Gammaproteobacteria bacterium]|nr:alpha/beta fold hydrolase [Gammaproteobacteria bacterium]
MDVLTILLLVLAAALASVAISICVEALRKPTQTPAGLYWNARIPVEFTEINGMQIRHIKTGHGPNLVLLHTLRTQLDIFQKIIPELARDFTVHALDYPGHGFSAIPDTQYAPDLFVRTVEGFLERMDIRDATLAGVSIGACIPLLLVADGNTRIKKIVAMNPYDYARGTGLTRAGLVAWLIFTAARVSVLGETVMRLRNRLVERLIMEGGVARPEALPREFLEQMFVSGEREGHYRAFLNLIRHAYLWDDCHHAYGRIRVPVLLVYGDRDWSRPEERRRTAGEIPGSRVETVAAGGHFLPLDQPGRVAELIKGFAQS